VNSIELNQVLVLCLLVVFSLLLQISDMDKSLRIREQGAEKKISTKEGGSGGRLEKTAY
jgi:preprotein translocase subunit SecG